MKNLRFFLAFTSAFAASSVFGAAAGTITPSPVGVPASRATPPAVSTSVFPTIRIHVLVRGFPGADWNVRLPASISETTSIDPTRLEFRITKYKDPATAMSIDSTATVVSTEVRGKRVRSIEATIDARLLPPGIYHFAMRAAPGFFQPEPATYVYPLPTDGDFSFVVSLWSALASVEQMPRAGQRFFSFGTQQTGLPYGAYQIDSAAGERFPLLIAVSSLDDAFERVYVITELQWHQVLRILRDPSLESLSNQWKDRTIRFSNLSGYCRRDVNEIDDYQTAFAMGSTAIHIHNIYRVGKATQLRPFPPFIYGWGGLIGLDPVLVDFSFSPSDMAALGLDDVDPRQACIHAWMFFPNGEDVVQQIEGWYNPRRWLLAVGYASPRESERRTRRAA